MAAYYRTLMQLRAMNPPTPPPMVINNCDGLGLFYYHYDMAEKPLTILNNGHGISLDFKGHGLGSITHDGYTFDVLSINFHAYGEHQFHGEELPLELHIVHREPETNHILVVAVPFDYTPGSADVQSDPGTPPVDDGPPAAGFLQ